MMDIAKLDKEYTEIHDYITLTFDKQTTEQYELFCHFMEMYELEKSLKALAFKRHLTESEGEQDND